MPNYFQQPQQPQWQPQQGTVPIVFINGEEDVNFYPVGAGASACLVAFSLGKAYLKTTSRNGVPEPLRVFEFKEIVAPAAQPNGNFATRDEVAALSSKLDQLISALGGEK